MDRRRTRMREMADILYTLKQQLGVPAQVYRISVDSVDRAAGTQSVSRTVKNIKRMIILPDRQIMKFQQSISYLAANKNFTYGGQFEVGDREVIIDGKDLGFDYVFLQNDYIVFDGGRFNIVDNVTLDFRKGWYLHLRKTQSQPAYQIASGLFVERPTLVETFVREP